MNERRIVLWLRAVMAFIFLWAFFDKLIGLGFGTARAHAWINGGSPTAAFLALAVRGPFESFFHMLSGVAVVDWLFMLGLLFVGLTLALNKYVKWGALAGIAMLALMYLALLFPMNNPIIDDHIVYILVLLLIYLKGRSN